VMTDVQQDVGGGTPVDSVRNAALAVELDRPLLDQRAEVQDFFRSAADAMEDLANDGRTQAR